MWPLLAADIFRQVAKQWAVLLREMERGKGPRLPSDTHASFTPEEAVLPKATW